jgi:hypothetical protein
VTQLGNVKRHFVRRRKLLEGGHIRIFEAFLINKVALGFSGHNVLSFAGRELGFVTPNPPLKP